MFCNKKEDILPLILKITQLSAVVWTLLVTLIYLSILTNVLFSLPYEVRDVFLYIEYFGIWGGPVLSIISCIELLIIKFKAKHLKNVSSKLTIVSIVIPLFFITAIVLYELNIGEVLS